MPELTALTAMERELLTYVEGLTRACEQSARALHDLEQRSTAMIERKIASLIACVTSLAASQRACTEGLKLWLSESATYAQIEDELNRSLEALSAAEMRLKSASTR